MNSDITVLDTPLTSAHVRTILAENGFGCTLWTLSPREETPWHESHHVEEHLIFVVEGEATVRFADVNTVLNKDQALLIPQGKEYRIEAMEWTKLLRIDVPPRQIVTPQILSFDR